MQRDSFSRLPTGKTAVVIISRSDFEKFGPSTANRNLFPVLESHNERSGGTPLVHHPSGRRLGRTFCSNFGPHRRIPEKRGPQALWVSDAERLQQSRTKSPMLGLFG